MQRSVMEKNVIESVNPGRVVYNDTELLSYFENALIVIVKN